MIAASVNVSKRSINLLRISIGIIYLWFGALKFFHGYSPAEDLAINTINKLTFDLIPQPVNIILLAAWECAVGIALIIGKGIRTALILLFVHMVCTFTPLLFFPSVSFKYAPYGFTLVGQYIMKNIIIICAAIVIWPVKEKQGYKSPY
ncbi:MAG: DoxX family membrane protein [Sphingobacteriales bacterium]|nr:DoxX family membrane protein [Sphingobacteriales bacterium]